MGISTEVRRSETGPAFERGLSAEHASDRTPDGSADHLADRSAVSAADACPDPTRPQRADARRNRERLIEHAAAMFADKGVDAPLEDIARSTGVGIGTLYRHFPAREDLVLAVYYLEVDKLCESAADLLRTKEPIDALSDWMHDFVAYVAAKRGLAACMKSMMQKNTALFDQTRRNLNDAADSLLTAAAAAGQVRGDVDGRQLLRAMGGICMANDAADWREHATRLLGLLLDGLRYGAPAAARS